MAHRAGIHLWSPPRRVVRGHPEPDHRAAYRTAPGLGSIVAGAQAAQLALVLVASATVGSWTGRREGYRRVVAVPASALIAAVGLLWAVERLAS